MEHENQLTKRIIGCCFKVHRYLGPGFSKKVYHNALKLLFDKEGLRHESEKASDIRIGLLINFGNKSCQVKRVMF
jgi:hypothetical protein